MQAAFFFEIPFSMKTLFRKIHLWLSVPFGLIISLICFSGALLVFEKEVIELCDHDLYYVKSVESPPLPIGKLLEKVTETLPEGVSVTGVTIFSKPERTYQIGLSKPRHSSIYVDQYTGEIKGQYERNPFFTFMFKLHRWLLDGVKQDGSISIGKLIVGISTLMFVFVLLTGVFIWWPRTRKALKNSLKIATDKGLRRFWYDLHVAGGIYTLLLLLAMALTGLTWSFSWYRTGFYKVFGAEVHKVPGPGSVSKQTHGRGGDKGKTSAVFSHWQGIYEELKERNPGNKQITISYGSANVFFDGFGNQRASDRYIFNLRNGKITEEILYKETDRAGKIRGWIYSVHVGSWGGMVTRILSFIAALLGATLPLTGYYLWIRKWKQKKKSLSR